MLLPNGLLLAQALGLDGVLDCIRVKCLLSFVFVRTCQTVAKLLHDRQELQRRPFDHGDGLFQNIERNISDGRVLSNELLLKHLLVDLRFGVLARLVLQSTTKVGAIALLALVLRSKRK